MKLPLTLCPYPFNAFTMYTQIDSAVYLTV